MVISEIASNFNYFSLIIAYSFYGVVFIVGEIARRIVERFISPGNVLHCFLIEAIATAQMCTCVYENAIILRHYGAVGFFFVVASVLFLGGCVNRGAFISPLAPIELFFYQTIGIERFLALLSAELIGAYSAFRIARQLWYWSLDLSVDHILNYETSTFCSFTYKVPFALVLGFEIIACYLMRTIFSYVSVMNYKQYFIPPIISAFLTIALVIIGIPGLNPIVATSRWYGCDGLTTSWFITVYWTCPIIGWMASAIMQKRKSAVVEKKKE
ncbi:unnamed protein product [Dracunculus medinensis]|uniref:Aquaporin n=1 Tax=Dracunculus medinensis TaxID=318479 RepID=A0A0N4U2T0_DRAME|nr:unnamed protein product [Dracunculus medinensis]